MPNKKEQILVKIKRIEKYLNDLSLYKNKSIKDFNTDIILKNSLERLLYLICDSIISLMEMVITYKNLQKAVTYGENVDILFEARLINDIDADYLHKIVGLRNILSHDYEKLDFNILIHILKIEIKKLNLLIIKIEKSL